MSHGPDSHDGSVPLTTGFRICWASIFAMQNSMTTAVCREGTVIRAPLEEPRQRRATDVSEQERMAEESGQGRSPHAVFDGAGVCGVCARAL
jgi:hypothetical protein